MSALAAGFLGFTLWLLVHGALVLFLEWLDKTP